MRHDIREISERVFRCTCGSEFSSHDDGEEHAANARIEDESKAIDDRLPDGAQFSVVWNATAMKWQGRLTIPAAHNALRDEGMLSFVDEARGVFPLLMRLDRQYRRHAQLPKRKRSKVAGKRKAKQL